MEDPMRYSGETASPESIAGLVKKIHGRIAYELDSSEFEIGGFIFSPHISARFQDGFWTCRCSCHWREVAGKLQGYLNLQAFEFEGTDRKKATIDALTHAMGEYVIDILEAFGSAEKMQESIQEVLENQLRAEQFRAESDERAKRLESWLHGLMASGEMIKDCNMGKTIPFVPATLMAVAIMKMRGRKYSAMAHSKKGHLTFSKENGECQAEVRLPGIPERIIVTTQGTTVIGRNVLHPEFQYVLPYTWALNSSRLVEIEAALKAIDSLDTLNEIINSGSTYPQCLCCGRYLSDPSSLSRWVGPECIKGLQTFVQLVQEGEFTKAS
jgi:hypothetical protein